MKKEEDAYPRREQPRKLDPDFFNFRSKDPEIGKEIHNLLKEGVIEDFSEILQSAAKTNKKLGAEVQERFLRLKAMKDNETDFKKVGDLKYSTSYIFSATNGGVPTMKNVGKLNAPLMDIFGLILCPTKYKKVLKEAKVVERYTNGLELWYENVKIPWPLADRDFSLLYMINFSKERGVVYFYRGSVVSSSIPITKDHERGFVDSLWILEDISENQCLVTYIGELDLCGSVPNAIKQKAAKKQQGLIDQVYEALLAASPDIAQPTNNRTRREPESEAKPKTKIIRKTSENLSPKRIFTSTVAPITKHGGPRSHSMVSDQLKAMGLAPEHKIFEEKKETRDSKRNISDMKQPIREERKEGISDVIPPPKLEKGKNVDEQEVPKSSYIPLSHTNLNAPVSLPPKKMKKEEDAYPRREQPRKLDPDFFNFRSKDPEIGKEIHNLLKEGVIEDFSEILQSAAKTNKKLGAEVQERFLRLKAMKDNETDFKKVGDLKYSTSYIFSATNGGVPTMKNVGKLNAPLMDIFGLILCPTKYKKVLKEAKVVERYTNGLELWYENVKIPWPLADRDFSLLYMINFSKERGVVYFYRGSVVSSSIPITKDHERGFVDSLWILEDISENQCLVTYIGELDLCGSVPNAIKQKAAKKQQGLIDQVYEALLAASPDIAQPTNNRTRREPESEAKPKTKIIRKTSENLSPKRIFTSTVAPITKHAAMSLDLRVPDQLKAAMSMPATQPNIGENDREHSSSIDLQLVEISDIFGRPTAQKEERKVDTQNKEIVSAHFFEGATVGNDADSDIPKNTYRELPSPTSTDEIVTVRSLDESIPIFIVEEEILRKDSLIPLEEFSSVKAIIESTTYQQASEIDIKLSKYEKVWYKKEVVEEKLKEIERFESKYETKEYYKRIFGLIDLTSLTAVDTIYKIRKLCKKINIFPRIFSSIPNVASIYVFPSLVEMAKKCIISEVEVGIGAIAGGFPGSQTFLEVKALEAEMVVNRGATEVDVIIPVGALLVGDYWTVYSEIQNMKQSVYPAKLKVILETGALNDLNLIRIGSLIAMEAGADFIKTSTGRLSPSVTPEAVFVICEAIAEYFVKNEGRKVGIKPDGGINTADDALKYFSIVAQVLGPAYLNSQLFRIGGYKLANSLLSRIFSENVSYF